jgi:phosphohistidine phosphatase
MTELFVLRHGIAVPRGTPGVADDDRPLTSKGRKRMRRIGLGLRRLDVEPEKIISSPLPRAWQTAEIVADALGLSDRLEEADSLRAEQGAGSIRDWLRSRNEDRLMIVGHNPALSQLLGLLVTGAADPWLCELKKGGIAALSPRPEGNHVLDWIAQPRILKRLS